MNAKHTPGPWRWDGDVCNYDPEDEAPWLVTEMHSAVVLGGSINCNNEANARLIAAAPELLNSLIECVEDSQAAVDEYVMNYGENWRPARLAALRAGVAKARAAIAKATGSTA